MSQSPPKPWTPGKQPAYTAFRLVVNICQDEFGNVWSDHDFLTPEDEIVASGLQHGGVPQVAHTLLTEAVRREVFTSALMMLGQNPHLLAQWDAAGEGRQQLERDISKAALHVITQTTSKMLPSAVPAVLAMIADQQTGSPLPSPRG